MVIFDPVGAIRPPNCGESANCESHLMSLELYSFGQGLVLRRVNIVVNMHYSYNLVDWDKLRSGFDQRGSFEELCCQLAREEEVPPNSVFTRLAPPDAGVECYWTLPTGLEWGWQAKYFRNLLKPDHWRQIDDSVNKALNTHPNLEKYFICLPRDRSDGRQSDQESFADKWDQHVEKWQRNTNIEFEYWGSSEIEHRLSQEKHNGRYKYFFDKQFLSTDWFKKHIEDSIVDAGLRYSPELNVELPIAKALDALGRTEGFYSTLANIAKNIANDFKYVISHEVVLEADAEFKELKSAINTIIHILRQIEKIDQKPIDFEKINTSLEKAKEIIHAAVTRLKNEQEDRNYIQSEIYHLQHLNGHLTKLKELTENDFCLVANTGALLLRGDAGSGKTHLLCDVANQRFQSKCFTILLHGSHFIEGNPKQIIKNELDLDCTFDDLLAALDAAGQANGSKVLIMIDALNEGSGDRIWPYYLRGILNGVSRYEWIGIVMSVRTDYESIVLPENLESEELSRITHNGFEGKLDAAIKILFDNNGIGRPRIPLLSPEFLNPQFLIVLCSGLRNRQMAEIPDSLQGLVSVYGFFIDSIDKKLSKKTRLDYPEHHKIVSKAIDAIVERMIERNARFLEFQEADQLLSGIYPTGGISKSLINNLISEGVLNKWHKTDNSGLHKPFIQFTYERLTDHLIVQNQLKNSSENDLLTSLRDGIFAKYLDERQVGILNALSIQIPEKFKKELITMEPRLAQYPVVRKSFLRSLLWRSPNSMEDLTLSVINEHILGESRFLNIFFEVLLTKSMDPNNRLNGEYLHEYLFQLRMNDRDSSWTIFLHRDYSTDNSIVNRYIDWAWHADKSHLNPESAYLASLTLAWFLVSSNRSIRDKATKALVSSLTNHIDVLIRILQKFKGCNDLYVIERLYCVAYGCSMRSNNTDFLKKLADVIYLEIFKNRNPPLNILLRDYAKGVIDCVLKKGIPINLDYSRVVPPYNSTWIDTFPTEAVIEALKIEHSAELHDGAIGIFNSLNSWGNFYRYVMGGNTQSFEWSDVKLLQNKESRSTKLHSFVNSLREGQMPLWKDYYEIARHKKDYRISEEVCKEMHGCGLQNYECIMEECKNELRDKLDTRQQSVFDDYVVPYLEYSFSQESRNFDLHSFARWVIKRVFEMGWTKDRFGRHDSHVAQSGFYSRDTGSERVGKKYQWIAYSELVAMVSDNFEFNSTSYELAFTVYRAPWQLLYWRGVDPSLPFSRTCKTYSNTQSDNWWISFKYDQWESINDDAEWLTDATDIPPLESSIEVTKPDDASEWLVLEVNSSFEQQISHYDDVSLNPYRYINFHLRCCLAKKSDIRRLYNCVKKHGDTSRMLPRHDSMYPIFLGELYWSESVQQIMQDEEPICKKCELEGIPPAKVYLPVCEYSLEHSSDYSVENSINILLPSQLLVEKMGLINKNNGTFVDSNNTLIAYDPTIYENGPSTLLIRMEAFVNFLQQNNYGIIWYVRGQKMIHKESISPEGSVGVEIQGIYKMINNKIRGQLIHDAPLTTQNEGNQNQSSPANSVDE